MSIYSRHASLSIALEPILFNAQQTIPCRNKFAGGKIVFMVRSDYFFNTWASNVWYTHLLVEVFGVEFVVPSATKEVDCKSALIQTLLDELQTNKQQTKLLQLVNIGQLLFKTHGIFSLLRNCFLNLCTYREGN